MMPSVPTFSIVVPTFQRADMVCRVANAIGAMEYCGKFELIVVVDGSTDDSVQCLESLEIGIPFKLIVQPNAGAAAARNAGAQEARGNVLLFLDDDMIAQPDLLQQHARSYSEGADAVLGKVVPDGEMKPGFIADGLADWLEWGEANDRPDNPLNVYAGHFSVRREVFHALDGFREGFTQEGRFGNEDVEFGLRLLRAHRLVHNREAITKHRYEVDVRSHVRRAGSSGRADAYFLRMHPEWSARLGEQRGAGKKVYRWFYRPMAAVPGLPPVLASVASIAGRLVLRSRWRHSRLFARGYYAARSLIYWASFHRAGGFPRARELLVLCYHVAMVSADDRVLAPYAVTPEQLKRDVLALEEAGYAFVGRDSLLALIEGSGRVPSRAVMLTFDDCYGPLLAAARDVMRARGIEGLAFAVTGLESNAWDEAEGATRLELLDNEGLRDLRRFGCEIGSHTRKHRPLPTLTEDEIDDEIAGSADDLSKMGFNGPFMLAYPFGMFDDRAVRACARAGYAGAFLVNRMGHDYYVRPGTDRFRVPRLEITPDTGIRHLRLRARYPRLARRILR